MATICPLWVPPTSLVELPSDYVQQHVELAYASTSHASQGRTVDRSFRYLDGGTNAAGIYVPIAYVGGAGYVGVGEVTGPTVLLRDFEVQRNGEAIRVVDQPEATDAMRERANSSDPEITEYAVPVRWLAERDVSDAVQAPGLFASQVTVCKLRDERTIDVVSTAFGLNAHDGG